MIVKKVYATSKGKFWSYRDAALTTNRSVRHHRINGHDFVEYEPVTESFVLIHDDNVFQLYPTEVK